MGAFILNEENATDIAQSEVDEVDWTHLSQLGDGDGVVSGMEVTATGAQTVSVATGVVRIAGVLYSHTGPTVVSLDAAHATLDRFDLIECGVSGTPTEIAGTAASLPDFPARTASTVWLAAVYRAANDNTTAASDITDKRSIQALEGDLTGDLYADNNALWGGRADGDTLILGSNDVDSSMTIDLRSPLRFYEPGVTFSAYAEGVGIFSRFIEGDTITIDHNDAPFYGGGSFRATAFDGTVEFEQAASVLGMGFLFSHQATYQNVTGEANNLGPCYALVDQPTINANNQSISAGSAANAGVQSVRSSPKLTVTGGSGALTLGEMCALYSGCNIGVGTTLSNRFGAKIRNATVGGTLTSQTGLLVEQLSTGTNSSGIVLGRTTIPSGRWAIYNDSSYANFMEGEIFFSTSTGPSLSVGSGAPTAAKAVGSIYLNTSGGSGTTVYGCHSAAGGAGSWHAL